MSSSQLFIILIMAAIGGVSAVVLRWFLIGFRSVR
jgi:hypothetical protein